MDKTTCCLQTAPRTRCSIALPSYPKTNVRIVCATGGTEASQLYVFLQRSPEAWPTRTTLKGEGAQPHFCG